MSGSRVVLSAISLSSWWIQDTAPEYTDVHTLERCLYVCEAFNAAPCQCQVLMVELSRLHGVANSVVIITVCVLTDLSAGHMLLATSTLESYGACPEAS